jgi:soluble lytic murein transglycosylase-like protein
MHFSKKISFGFLFAFLFLSFYAIDAQGKPEPLTYLLSKKTSILNSFKDPPTLMTDYRAYWKAQKVLAEKSPSLTSIESAERGLLLVKMDAVSKSLESQLSEQFNALEIRRAEILSVQKKDATALRSFQRAMQGLNRTKIPIYWNEQSSRALNLICTRNKKEKNELSLALARRILDIFPKNAVEVKPLQSLQNYEGMIYADYSGDRLTQTYSEKIEKDEVALQEILEHFLFGRSGQLEDAVKSFHSNFPKSALRFRVQFLMAESYFRRNKIDEARPLYLSLIEQAPLGFYAVVSAERLGMSLKDRMKKQPIMIDREGLNFNQAEMLNVRRIEELSKQKKSSEVAIEVEALNRVRNYSFDSILFLMGMATKAGQHLSAFRLANELIQRQYDGLLNSEILEMIFPLKYEKEVSSTANQLKMDPVTILSLTKQESGFNPIAISSSGALGLMQLMPFTAIDVQKDIVLSSLMKADVNFTIGSKYLLGLIERFQGNLPLALAGYNAGPHRAVKWKRESSQDVAANMIDFIESIPYRETRDYVMAIVRNRYWYQVRMGLPAQSVFMLWK